MNCLDQSANYWYFGLSHSLYYEPMGFQFLSEIITSILVMNYLFSKCKINDILDRPHQISQWFMMNWSLAIIVRQESCMGRSCRVLSLMNGKWRFCTIFNRLDVQGVSSSSPYFVFGIKHSNPSKSNVVFRNG